MSNFENDFRDAVVKLKADAAEEGISLTAVCTKANVSRATPDRWLREPPKTVLLLSEMQKIVADKKAENEKIKAEGEAHLIR